MDVLKEEMKIIAKIMNRIAESSGKDGTYDYAFETGGLELFTVNDLLDIFYIRLQDTKDFINDLIENDADYEDIEEEEENIRKINKIIEDIKDLYPYYSRKKSPKN